MEWQRLVRHGLLDVAPYHVTTASCPVKLDGNESPFPLSERARALVMSALAEVPLHRYPDPRAQGVRSLWSAQLGCTEEELILGNGYDELILLLCSTFAEARGTEPATVLLPTPTFSIFRTDALACGQRVAEVPLPDDFSADGETLLVEVARRRPNLVFLATPNNPTGTLWPRSSVIELVMRHPEVMVVVDEAYAPYSEAPSCVELARRYPNCLVLRTLSKIGMAGLRLGCLVGRREVLAEVEKIRPPYNVNALTQSAAAVLLRDCMSELEAHCAEVRTERQRLFEELGKRSNLEVFPSAGNFLLFRVNKAAKVHARLLEQGVLVRAFGSGRLQDCLRVTIGTPAENQQFVAALAAAL